MSGAKARDTVGWLKGGYPNTVSIGDDIHANPGAFSGSLQNALQTLVDNHTWFALPVFEAAIKELQPVPS